MNTDLEVNIRRAGKVPVVDLAGDVDTFTCSKLRETIVNLINEGDFRVVIDMAEVNYIDSSGLGTIIGGLGRVKEQNGSLALSGVTPRVERVLRVTGLNSLLPIYETENDAIESLQAQE